MPTLVRARTLIEVAQLREGASAGGGAAATGAGGSGAAGD